MGTPSYATEIFKKLLSSNYEVIGLFTQPDKPVGRKQVLTPPDIKQFCIDNSINIPIFQPERLRDNLAAYLVIKELKPDYIIVAAYGQILPKEILKLAPCINLHASLLPKYRGASPIQESLLNDDNFTGVTSMFMEEGLDSGDILALQYLKITPTMEVSEAFSKLSLIAADLTITTLDNFDRLNPIKQNESEVSFCKKIKKENGLVDFSDAKNLFLKYKAYSFWPGIFLESELKLKDIELLEETSQNEAGKILDICKDYIIVGCKKGSLKIKTLQAPSKKAINSVDFVRGQRVEIGDILA
ncbi:methionyl-tRNA formyltransferase [Aliarcobacter butzleri]|uniref:Methionyl-tRNA formyltransferase n=2 Tax=Aliarcobacter butzleri TaxID=28197 RepID=A0AAW7QBH0_9BACT|nr:methionyl-tRNA formyltransferase [Aliarcobacter butzleri]MCG3651439.1 methionyl-tRNA formyltransferase [Aliarcobacter butzleri]MCG3658002.1 methionyl-tRNA formyltransferase [Aliarcobacter butzleri]MCG3690010.1 methionyl-tRNA formyltransferase [Aliarcobacter butzleri]MDN5068450.1 methionyl-tRNA formyltransferase [Aliarcobacter butzleri]MDN5107017.1 methionyl-tRNA formyltransferase [Aliarcobacter butzleri]